MQFFAAVNLVLIATVCCSFNSASARMLGSKKTKTWWQALQKDQDDAPLTLAKDQNKVALAPNSNQSAVVHRHLLPEPPEMTDGAAAAADSNEKHSPAFTCGGDTVCLHMLRMLSGLQAAGRK